MMVRLPRWDSVEGERLATHATYSLSKTLGSGILKMFGWALLR